MRMLLFFVFALDLACDGAPYQEARSALTGTLQVLPVHASAARPREAAGAPWFDGAAWNLGVDAIEVFYPVPIIVGDTITEWAVFGRRDSKSQTAAQLHCVDAVDGLSFPVGPLVIDDDSASGYFALQAHLKPPAFADEDCAWAVRVIGGFAGGDRIGNVNVNVMRGP